MFSQTKAGPKLKTAQVVETMVSPGATVCAALADGIHLVGVCVARAESETIVAADPSAALVAKRYTVQTKAGATCPVVFVAVSNSALERDDRASWKASTVLSLDEDVDLGSLLQVYQAESTSSGDRSSARGPPGGLPAVALTWGTNPLPSASGTGTVTVPALGMDEGKASQGLGAAGRSFAGIPRGSRSSTLGPSSELAMVMGALRDLQAELADQKQVLRRLQTQAASPPAGATTRSAPSAATWASVLGGDGDDEEDEVLGNLPAAPKRADGTTRGGVHFNLPEATASRSMHLAAPPAGPSQLEQLTALLREVRRTRSSGELLSDDEDEVSGHRMTGLRGVHRMREELYQNTNRVIARYVAHIKKQIGVSDGRQFWRVRDWSVNQSSRFGRMRGMLRVYVMLGDILDHVLHGCHAVAGALLVQGQKALLQMALDGGSWENARLLGPEPDPYEQAEFGGLEEEMARVHRYRKAITDLKTRAKALSTEGDAAGNDDEETTRARFARTKAGETKNGKTGTADA